MAFALPSFNAAVASASSSGAPLARMQANIDFKDVKSDIATKALTKLPLEKFIVEANIAKQALAEYGDGLQRKMLLDYNREVNETNRKDAKRTALVNMLMGGAGELEGALKPQPYSDPRSELLTEMLFRQGRQGYLQSEMGGLHPDTAQKAAVTGAPLPKLPGAGVAPEIKALNPTVPAPAKMETPTPSQTADLYKAVIGNMRKQGLIK